MPCGPCQGGLQSDLDVLTENRQKFQEPADRDRNRSAAHQGRHLSLGSTKKLCGFDRKHRDFILNSVKCMRPVPNGPRRKRNFAPS